MSKTGTDNIIVAFFKKKWVKEILIFLIALGIYQLSRIFAITEDEETVFGHAMDIVNFEKATGMFIEIPIQQWFLERIDLLKALNQFYMKAHLPVTILFFVFLFNMHRDKYPFIRNVFLLGNLIAVFFYIFYPCAPPRMLNEYGNPFGYNLGFVDTLKDISDVNLYKGNLSKTFNQYAAVPSMHFGYSFLIGFVVIYLFKNYAIKLLGFLYPLTVLVVIVATGNHFIIDAVLGGLIMVASFYIYKYGLRKYFEKDAVAAE